MSDKYKESLANVDGTHTPMTEEGQNDTPIVLSKYKVLFADLDGTLIDTASGKLFAEDPTDFRIKKDVLDVIREKMPNVEFVCVCSNQGGIPQYMTEEEFETKMLAVNAFITRYCSKGVIYEYCASLDKDNPYRKPNTGMLSKLLNKINAMMEDCNEPLFSKSDCVMIGDASGKEGDFSDSDKRTAENFGIDYIDVLDFVECT